MAEKKLSHSDMVDRLGVIKRELDALSLEDSQLRDSLKNAYPAPTEVFGKAYVATIGESVRREINVDKVKKLLSPVQFMQVITVQLKSLARFCSVEQIDKVSKVKSVVSTITIREIAHNG